MDTLPAAADAMVWRTVAAGALVLPAPTTLTTHDTAGRRHLVLSVPTAADAAAWADWLGLADAETQVFGPYTGQSGTQRPGFTDYTGYRSGWHWTIRGQGQPEPAPAKPLITSAPELAAAYGIEWPADSCHCCGARILDGRCCSWDNPEITGRPVHCVCPKGQGVVAVQQPGRGAS